MRLNKEWNYKEYYPTISAYVTAYNCIQNGYPILQAVKSFAWCDEVVVIDGGSTDDTVVELAKLQEEFPHLQVYPIPLDWENPGKDGMQKAMARAMCSSEFSIQFDADEICIGKPDKWKRFAKDMSCDILQLPVLEPFGEFAQLRLNPEHNPVKWRIFKNKSEITHGIPKKDRLEKDDKTFSKGGSDGCFPIHIVDQGLYPSKLSQEAQKVRGLYGKDDQLEEYVAAVESIITDERPAVLHLGHVDLSSKIKLFLAEWRKWWADLYDKDPEDVSMYFSDLKLEDVTDKEILDRVEELKRETSTVEIKALLEFEGLSDVRKGYCL